MSPLGAIRNSAGRAMFHALSPKRCQTRIADDARASSTRMLKGSPVFDVAPARPRKMRDDGDDLNAARRVLGECCASSPNRRPQFGHQVPRWKASMHRPFIEEPLQRSQFSLLCR